MRQLPSTPIRLRCCSVRGWNTAPPAGRLRSWSSGRHAGRFTCSMRGYAGGSPPPLGQLASSGHSAWLLRVSTLASRAIPWTGRPAGGALTCGARATGSAPTAHACRACMPPDGTRSVGFATSRPHHRLAAQDRTA
eukprot:scaffold3043_cov360-Prasinococcus_capsulatus_cf.AAC.14